MKQKDLIAFFVQLVILYSAANAIAITENGPVVVNEIVAATADRVLLYDSGVPTFGWGKSWFAEEFDDSGWKSATGAGLASLMQGTVASLYSRLELVVDADDLLPGNSLESDVNFDGGFILWINGVEALRKNLGKSGLYVYHDQRAFFDHPAAGFENFVLGAAGDLLKAGSNTIAIQAHSFDESFELQSELRIAESAKVLVPLNAQWNYFVGRNEPSGMLLDEDAEIVDWVELHNTATSPVMLAGWSLTDERDTPQKWVFPERSIDADGFLVVYASGKNRVGDELHTSFDLDKDGEYLALFDASQQLVWSIDRYPDQQALYSFGRVAATDYQFFNLPTPGSANALSTAVAGFIQEPVFDQAAGFHDGAIEVSISSATPDSSIFYTTDGSEPSQTNGILFGAGIMINQTTALRTRAFKAGLGPSSIATRTFIIGADANLKTLPSISIVSDAGANLNLPNGIMSISGGHYDSDVRADVGPVWVSDAVDDYNIPMQHGRAFERPVSLELVQPGGSAGFQINCGMRTAGSDTHRQRYRLGEDWIHSLEEKFSFRAYFRGDYGAAKLEYPLFDGSPVKRFDVLTLRSGHNDFKNPLIIDELARRLHRDMGWLGSRGMFATLHVNGTLRGLYNPTERIDEKFLADHLDRDGDWDIIRGVLDADLFTVEATSGDDAMWLELIELVTTQDFSAFENLAKVEAILNLDSFIDFVLLHAYGATGDMVNNNWIAFRSRDGGRFQYIIWDAELAMGSALSIKRTPDYNYFSNELSRTEYSVPLMYQAFKTNPEFRLRFADRLYQHFFNGGGLANENISRRNQELRGEVQPALEQLTGEPMNNFIQESWIELRRDHFFQHLMLEQLWPQLEPPVFSQQGGAIDRGNELTMTNQNAGEGEIYYTIDGSDPRVWGSGAVSPQAILYSDAVAVEVSVVKARVKSGEVWSPLNTAVFEINYLPGAIVISEFMAWTLGDNDGKEWFEVFNTTSLPIDINGWIVSDNDDDFHVIESDGPLIVSPKSHFVFGESVNVVLNGNAAVDYAFGGAIKIGNANDELILIQGDRVIDSVGYGAFKTGPREILTLPGLPPQRGFAMGIAQDYCDGQNTVWALQDTIFNAAGNRGTPGRMNDDSLLCFETNLGFYAREFILGRMSLDQEKIDLLKGGNGFVEVEDLLKLSR